MPSSLNGTGVSFSDGTSQDIARNWNVTYTNVTVSAGGVYNLPANCIGVCVWCLISGAGNNGGTGQAVIRNSGNGVLFTMNFSGTNYNRGGDGGSGMSDGVTAFIPVPRDATNILLQTVSNAVSSQYIVQAYVTSY